MTDPNTLEARVRRLEQLVALTQPIGARIYTSSTLGRDALAPSPDYAIAEPREPEPCSCDEAVALRKRVADLEQQIIDLTRREALA